MTKGSGGGSTHPRLVKLIQEEITKKGQRVVELETGLSHSMLSRYKRGVGEPTTATLEKFARYIAVTVGYLRGEYVGDESGVNICKLLDIYFSFIESLGTANEIRNHGLCFTYPWFHEMRTGLHVKYRTCEESRKTTILSYLDKCDALLIEYRNWQRKTGGLLGGDD